MYFAYMKSHVTPSLVLSVLALFVALGGTGYAISKLPANSVGTKQVKKNAINSSKVKNRSLLAKDFKADQLPAGQQGETGQTGPTGATGASGEAGQQGDPGSALAYAYVEDLGGPNVNVVPASSKGLDSSMVSRPDTGVYCFELSSLGTVRNVVATAESSFNSVAESDKTASAQLLQNSDFGFGCPTDSDMVVVIQDQSDAAAKNWFFYVTLN